MIEMKEVVYKCAQCGATDTLRVELHEQPWPAMNCWKCKAGFSNGVAKNYMTHDEMVMRRIGMFPESNTRTEVNA